MGIGPLPLFRSTQLRFFGNIDEATKTAFSGDTTSNSKKLLLTLICLVAFDLTQGRTPRCAGRASRFGYLGHVRSYVFTHQQLQSTLRNYAFVIPMRHEEIKTSRTPNRDVCTRQRPGQDDGIGEQQSSAWFQKPCPLRNHAWPIGKVVDS